MIDYIEEKLLQTWSPEQIANAKCDFVVPSFKTIYRWLYEGYLLNGNLKVLRKKGKARKRVGNGGRFTTGKSIRAYINGKKSDIVKSITCDRGSEFAN